MYVPRVTHLCEVEDQIVLAPAMFRARSDVRGEDPFLPHGATRCRGAGVSCTVVLNIDGA